MKLLFLVMLGLGPGYKSTKKAALLTPSNTVFYRVKCFHMLFNVIPRG